MAQMGVAVSMKYKFHYGDKVVVHSSAWKKSCYPDDEFVNVCGKVGIIIDRWSDPEGYCSPGLVYQVQFEFEDLDTFVNQTYCEVHLRKAK